MANKRIYDLTTGTAADDFYIAMDKSGNAEALKVALSSLATYVAAELKGLCYNTTFTKAELDANGQITITHSLGDTLPLVQVFNANNECIDLGGVLSITDGNNIVLDFEHPDNITTGNHSVIVYAFKKVT